MRTPKVGGGYGRDPREIKQKPSCC